MLILGSTLSNCQSDPDPDFNSLRGGALGAAGEARGGVGGSMHAGAGRAGTEVSRSGAGGELESLGGAPEALAGYAGEAAGDGGDAGAGAGGMGAGAVAGTAAAGTGTGAVAGTNAGGAGIAGSGAGAGGTGAGGSGAGAGGSLLGIGVYQGSGTSTERYAVADVYRDGVGYKFIANGWGPNWQSQDMSWSGSSFTVTSLAGAQGSAYQPAGYPSMFCGWYANQQSQPCGLPATISSLLSLRTGWRWKANGNNGQYNAAFDIWLSTTGSTKATSYLMLWLRDPIGQQPAGTAVATGVTVSGLPGKWNIMKGTITGNNLPIVSYVQPEGGDLSEVEFDVLDLQKDAIQRNYTLPGSTILSVAVGFEVWNGPIANLASEDFYVDAKLK